MKIKMLEYFQGTNQPSLTLGKEYESNDIGQGLCDWLLEHGKAQDVTPKPKPKPEPEKELEAEPQVEKPEPRARSTKRGRVKE